MAAMSPTTAADPDKRAPGRPRSARAEQAIIDAVLALLEAGVSIEALSMEAVAARAGVGKATIYRRWPSKEELVVEAIASVKLPMPVLSGGSVRDDLVTMLRSTAMERDEGRGGVMTCVLSQLSRSPELYGWYQRVVEPRRESMREVLRRGVHTGELRADLDIEVTVGLLVAPMIIQRMTRWNPRLDVDDLPERIVDAVLGGAAHPAAVPGETGGSRGAGVAVAAAAALAGSQ
jgi:AcrR family transcriptional regulator